MRSALSRPQPSLLKLGILPGIFERPALLRALSGATLEVRTREAASEARHCGSAHLSFWYLLVTQLRGEAAVVVEIQMLDAVQVALEAAVSDGGGWEQRGRWRKKALAPAQLRLLGLSARRPVGLGQAGQVQRGGALVAHLPQHHTVIDVAHHALFAAARQSQGGRGAAHSPRACMSARAAGTSQSS